MPVMAYPCDNITDKQEAYVCYKESIVYNRLRINEYMATIAKMPWQIALPIQKKHKILMREIKDICGLSARCSSASYESHAQSLEYFLRKQS